MSVDKVPDAAKTITTIRVRLPENRTTFTKTLFLTEKHLAIKAHFNHLTTNLNLGDALTKSGNNRAHDSRRFLNTNISNFTNVGECIFFLPPRIVRMLAVQLFLSTFVRYE